MVSLTRPGRFIFAMGMAALGVLTFIYSDSVSGLEPVPAWIPGRLLWAYLTGVVLIGTGVCLLVNKGARPAAIALGLMLLLWLALLQAPHIVANPSDGNAWTTTFETLALCSVAWVLAGRLETRQGIRQRWSDAVILLANAGRICFGISMLVFGCLHLIYAAFVGMLVPVWMPWRLYWPYVTGVAFIAAGVSILIKVRARLAATLLGVMFGLWVLLLHAPRVAAKPHDRAEWTSLLVATAMCGGAWLVAGSVARAVSAKRTEPNV